MKVKDRTPEEEAAAEQHYQEYIKNNPNFNKNITYPTPKELREQSIKNGIIKLKLDNYNRCFVI